MTCLVAGIGGSDISTAATRHAHLQIRGRVPEHRA
jgi:hypothetical protein